MNLGDAIDCEHAFNASEERMASRTIVVGDIHGCYDELMELLEKAALAEDDRVVSVGDLI